MCQRYRDCRIHDCCAAERRLRQRLRVSRRVRQLQVSFGSGDGDAWRYFPHDPARSRAYRWGEDGLAGFSDKARHWCLGLALWNERAPILKERLFGLNNAEGNHGEDVKELYFYVDGVPSHAYRRMLYKYPQAEFPYTDLIAENASRDLVLFHGYFHGETGRGLGASHQTGWSALVALLLQR